eukprot:gnl/TRDRNA2_/TRDRNA2_40397_c1_seq1.p1 gnl/TRDRNA2_/TRDRNA2_40397_c1~~gnl/TRDRNA2_/TRDRNA2_40397_c1_seq1.p1  ORF type:complete len:488 (-),score=92.48 gnl/TRDRNA2_/TRDRNA2_40397_c1_seq1:169-1470(-)
MAARGSLLLAVTRSAGGGDADSPLEFRLLDVNTRTQRAAGRLPLSPGAQLRWLSLSAELAPVTIDTDGVVRVLLGSGPGAWGPVGGGGGEWVQVLSLAEEESRVGPIWAVRMAAGVLFYAEAGVAGFEPQPAVPDDKPGQDDAVDTVAAPIFGRASSLRELRWRLPLGFVAAIGSGAEEALREQLLARHAAEAAAIGAEPASEGASAEVLERAWRTRSFQLFGHLAKAGEVERALDVARNFLAAPGGSSHVLNMAQAFAEKAGHHRLADEIAALPRVAACEAPAAVSRTVAAPAAVPKVATRELAPLFEPGEFSEAPAAAPAESPETPTPLQQAPAPSPTPASPSVARAVATSSPVLQAPAKMVTPTKGAPPPSTVEAAPPVSSNPFARTRKVASPHQAPHLLRDALGAGVRRSASAISSGGAGEPAAKVGKR